MFFLFRRPRRYPVTLHYCAVVTGDGIRGVEPLANLFSVKPAVEEFRDVTVVEIDICDPCREVDHDSFTEALVQAVEVAYALYLSVDPVLPYSTCRKVVSSVLKHLKPVLQSRFRYRYVLSCSRLWIGALTEEFTNLLAQEMSDEYVAKVREEVTEYARSLARSFVDTEVLSATKRGEVNVDTVLAVAYLKSIMLRDQVRDVIRNLLPYTTLVLEAFDHVVFHKCVDQAIGMRRACSRMHKLIDEIVEETIKRFREEVRRYLNTHVRS